jgi:hypothetical protein
MKIDHVNTADCYSIEDWHKSSWIYLLNLHLFSLDDIVSPWGVRLDKIYEIV